MWAGGQLHHDEDESFKQWLIRHGLEDTWATVQEAIPAINAAIADEAPPPFAPETFEPPLPVTTKWTTPNPRPPRTTESHDENGIPW